MASNREGRKATPISSELKELILNDIKNYNVGYDVLYNKYGISQTKLNYNNIFTNRLPVNYLNSLKVSKKADKKYEFKELRNKKVLWVDQSDLSDKSLEIANKHTRTIRINGLLFKLAIATTGLKSVLIVNEQESSGELKDLWSEIILKAIKNGLDFDLIALDSQAKFNDSPKPIIRIIKNNLHPYNSLVEGKIRQLKKLFYGLFEANSKNISQFRGIEVPQLKNVNQVKDLLYKLWEFIEFQENVIKINTSKIEEIQANKKLLKKEKTELIKNLRTEIKNLKLQKLENLLKIKIEA